MGLRRNRVWISTALSGVLLFSFTGSTALANTGSDLKSKLNSIQEDKKNSEEAAKKAKNELNDNQSQQQDVNVQIDQAEAKISDTLHKIAKKQNEVADTKKQIEVLKNNIADLKEKIARRDQLLKERVQAIYKNGGSIEYIQVLLGSNSFGDFIDRVLAMNTIASQDKKIIEEQKADKAQLEIQEKDVEKKLSKIQNDLKELVSLKAQLNEQKQQKQELLAKLQKEATELKDEAMSKQEEAKNLAAQEVATKKALAAWKAEQARLAREAAARKAAEKRAAARKAAEKRAAVAKQSGRQSSRSLTVRDSGNLAWPTTGRISSTYGWRTWSNGSHEFHPGLDIANGVGTPIVAAADGVVSRSYPSSSYGNCVIITHVINGEIYTTLYAHMRERLVSDGQTVKRGQIIGHIGMTGHTTGPHLHFEVYRGGWQPSNGTYHPGTINPMSMLN